MGGRRWPHFARTRWHAKAKVWAPTPGVPVDVTDVMEYLRRLADTYKVVEISFDPRFFDVPAKMLEDVGLPMIEIPQSVDRMTSALRAGVRDHQAR